MLPIAIVILIVLALVVGFYSFNVEASSSIYTYLGGIVLIFAGVLVKVLFDLLMVRRKEKEETKLLKDLMRECEENLELVESKKIRWPQVHFDVTSYTTAREKRVLSGFSSELQTQIVEIYKLISEIEKQKFRAFDKNTDLLLERLAKALPKIIKELGEKISS